MSKEESLDMTRVAACGARAPTSEYSCERPIGHTGDHSAKANSNEFPMTVEWLAEPTPEPETAFQGMVRKTLIASAVKADVLTLSWAEVKMNWPSTISRVRTVFNATLKLAGKALIMEAGKEAIIYTHRRAIEALKEPTL